MWKSLVVAIALAFAGSAFAAPSGDGAVPLAASCQTVGPGTQVGTTGAYSALYVCTTGDGKTILARETNGCAGYQDTDGTSVGGVYCAQKDQKLAGPVP